jgi:transcriptional repressor NrdR
MRCPICAKDNDKVVDSRASQDGHIIRRRRKCLNCGYKFTTYEAIEQTPLYVIKKDGRRELFQHEKLLGGIVTACKKRPVSMESIEKLVQAIEMEIHAGFQTEVPSWKIGEMVMKALKQIDEVAYVRFASVYRQFKDVKAFIDELQTLKHEATSRKHRKRSRQKGKETRKKEPLPLFSKSN